jgi:hypothetical protein
LKLIFFRKNKNKNKEKRKKKRSKFQTERNGVVQCVPLLNPTFPTTTIEYSRTIDSLSLFQMKMSSKIHKSSLHGSKILSLNLW